MKESKIPKFRRCVLQNFPFIEEDFDALTDYELLCKVVQYLNMVIDKVNKLDGMYEELNAAFVQLKNYVDTYFDNLDIQEEINAKLDEMAESGQLTEIIAQYLSLGAVIGYATISDMTAAENLVEGSICYVLENGGYYKVRAITNDDTVDNYFIVALHDNTLIAERVDNGVFKENMFLGAFHKKYAEGDRRSYLFFSNDAVNWAKIPNIEIRGESSDGGGDPSIIYDPETKYFLIAYSNQDTEPEVQCFTIMRSKDLIHWDEHPIALPLPPSIQGWNKWAPDWFKGHDGKLYIIFAADKTQNGFDFEPLITECTDVENLTFTNPYIANLDVQNKEYDFSIRYFNNKYYMVASDFGCIKLFTSLDLQNFSLVNGDLFKTKDYFGQDARNAVEGCNLEIINDKLYVYAEYPNMVRYAVSEIDTSNNTLISAKFMPSLQGYKHGSVLNLDNNHAQSVVNRIVDTVIDNNFLSPNYPDRMIITLTEDLTISELPLIPNQLIVINGNGHTLTINKITDPFRIYKMEFIMYDQNGTLSIGGYEEDQYSSYSYTANPNDGSSKKKVTVDFTFNALDDSYKYLGDGIRGDSNTTISGATGKIYYKQYGKVINVEVDITSSEYGYNATLGTIPSGIYPTRTITGVGRNVADDSTCIITVNPEGTVTIINGVAGRVIGNITYII